MERLACSAAAAYQPVEAAIHISRYAGALTLCAGKRVLDIACGEGYGACLMAQADAAAVVGIDASAAAIAAAETTFRHPNLRFLAGDVADLDEVLGEAQFDLIVSLETIEHLGDPAGFLRALRRRCAAGGTIILSCPNDHWYYLPNQQNPHHVRKYSFAEFRDLAEECLGAADAWYFGTAALGFTAVPIEGPAAGLRGADYADARPAPATFLCRPGGDDAVTRDRGSYFLGAWGPGATAAQGAALFPLSMDRYAAMMRSGDVAGQLAAETAARSRQLADEQSEQARREQAAQLAEAEAALSRSAEALREAESRLEATRQRAEQDLRLARVQLHALRKENDILSDSVARLRAEANQAQQLAAALDAERGQSLQLAAALTEAQAALDRQGDLAAAHAGLLEERDFLLVERERIFARMRPLWRVAQMIPPPVRSGMRRVARPVLRRLAPQG